MFSTHVVEDLAATYNQLAVMKNGKFLYSGNMKKLLEQARGHIWIYKTKDEGTARELEKISCFIEAVCRGRITNESN